jgi:hypothetical protein
MATIRHFRLKSPKTAHGKGRRLRELRHRRPCKGVNSSMRCAGAYKRIAIESLTRHRRYQFLHVDRVGQAVAVQIAIVNMIGIVIQTDQHVAKHENVAGVD